MTQRMVGGGHKALRFNAEEDYREFMPTELSDQVTRPMLDFLKALLKISKHKVILIREDTKIYGQSAVSAWLKTNEEKIKLFPNPTPDDPTLF